MSNWYYGPNGYPFDFACFFDAQTGEYIQQVAPAGSLRDLPSVRNPMRRGPDNDNHHIPSQDNPAHFIPPREEAAANARGYRGHRAPAPSEPSSPRSTGSTHFQGEYDEPPRPRFEEYNARRRGPFPGHRGPAPRQQRGGYFGWWGEGDYDSDEDEWLPTDDFPYPLHASLNENCEVVDMRGWTRGEVRREINRVKAACKARDEAKAEAAAKEKAEAEAKAKAAAEAKAQRRAEREERRYQAAREAEAQRAFAQATAQRFYPYQGPDEYPRYTYGQPRAPRMYEPGYGWY